MSHPQLPTILYLAESFPFDLAGGYQQRISSTILTLTTQARVRLLSFHPQSLTLKQQTCLVTDFANQLPPALKTQFLSRFSWEVIYEPKIHQPIQERWREWLKSFLTQQPFLVWQYQNSEFNLRLKNLINQLKPQVIHISHLRLAANLIQQLDQLRSAETTTPTRPRLIYEAVNVEWQLIASQVQYLSKWGRWRWWWWREEKLTQNFERRVTAMFDLIITLSDQDARDLKKLQPKIRQILVWPVTQLPWQNDSAPAPTSTLALTQTPVGTDCNLVFVGNLNWLPNADAIKWFLTEVWPTLALTHPNLKLSVIGESCSFLTLTPRVAAERVIFTGFVTELESWLNQAQIGILPFRMGSGVRLKALTYIFHNLPIVSTQLGMQGLDFPKNQTFLLAKNKSEFIQKINLLIANPQLRTQISQRALEVATAKHSFPSLKKIQQFWQRYWLK